MPITKERAASRFGLATYVPHSDFESLNNWKTELLLAQQEYEFDLAEIARKKRESELKQYEEVHYSLTHSLTHLLTYSLTHLLTYSLTHLLTYSLTQSVSYTSHHALKD
jgi:hypothetical protein